MISIEMKYLNDIDILKKYLYFNFVIVTVLVLLVLIIGFFISCISKYDLKVFST